MDQIKEIPKIQCVRTTRALIFEGHRARSYMQRRVGDMVGFIVTEENLTTISKEPKMLELCRELLEKKEKEFGGDTYCSVLMLQNTPYIVPVEWFEVY